MTCINENEVNKIAELNLLYDILNPSKRTKKLNIHYPIILHGFRNARNGRAVFKNFLILLDGVFSSMIVMGRLLKKTHS